MHKVIISNSFVTMAENVPTHTVEAEYGDNCVYGTKLTLAHHGSRSESPCPCLGDNIKDQAEDIIIGISHIDMDTLGGIYRILGLKSPDLQPNDVETMFWNMVAKIDILGYHKLDEIREQMWLELEYPDTIGSALEFFNERWGYLLEILHGMYAWFGKNEITIPEDGSIHDCTFHINEGCRVLDVLGLGDLKNDEFKRLNQDGIAWKKDQDDLNAKTLVEDIPGIIAFRVSDKFVNHMYISPTGTPYLGVVGFDNQVGSITISLMDPIEGVDCCQIMQQFYGPHAGGHKGIAGSPRNLKVTQDEGFKMFKIFGNIIKQNI